MVNHGVWLLRSWWWWYWYRGRIVACYTVGVAVPGPVPALQSLRSGVGPPPPGILRLCCYNILADTYAATTFSQVGSWVGDGGGETREAWILDKPSDLSTGWPKRRRSFRCLADGASGCPIDGVYFQQKVLYPYCNPDFLKIDYRSQLVLREIQSYEADIYCLQEVSQHSQPRIWVCSSFTRKAYCILLAGNLTD